MIRAKQISPVELMQAVLERIDRLEPQLNAMAFLDAEAAMAAAREAEKSVMGSAPLGRFHGLPVTVKDLADVRFMPTRAGSHTSSSLPLASDTPFVERLRGAGAIVIGKTTTSEFGWTGVSTSPLTGVTHNPWGHGLNAGASSAGAGVAAAAGYGPLHQGSDGAGSIRMPAHFCGIFGIKPSFGRVPYAPLGVGDNTSHVGAMTRTVMDSASDAVRCWPAPSLQARLAFFRNWRISPPLPAGAVASVPAMPAFGLTPAIGDHDAAV